MESNTLPRLSRGGANRANIAVSPEPRSDREGSLRFIGLQCRTCNGSATAITSIIETLSKRTHGDVSLFGQHDDTAADIEVGLTHPGTTLAPIGTRIEVNTRVGE